MSRRLLSLIRGCVHCTVSFVQRRPVIALVLLMTVYSCYFSYYTVIKHATYHSYAYDLGIYMQSLWTTVSGHGLFYTSLWEGSRFAYHCEPILFLILPIYKVLPRAETLLVLQSVCLASSALPLYLIARRLIGPWYAIAISASFLLNPGLHSVNSFDFHATALAIPLLLWCFHLFITGRYRTALVVALLAAMCRENVALVLVFMGLFCWWRNGRCRGRGIGWTTTIPHDRKVVFPLLLAGLATVWLLVAVFVVVPHFNETGAYFGFARYRGFVSDLFMNAQDKLAYVLVLLGPVLLTPLLDVAALTLALPALAQNLLSSKANMYSLGFNHAALVLPGLYIAAVYGVKSLLDCGARHSVAVGRRLMFLMTVASVTIALVSSPSPLALGTSMFRYGEHQRTLDAVVDIIPPEASVYTQNDCFPHVCQRLHAYAGTPQPRADMFEFYDGKYDFILMDTTSEQCTLNFATKKSIERLEKEYGVYADSDGVFLYKLGFEGVPIEIPQDLS